jgi:hypothetical protein
MKKISLEKRLEQHPQLQKRVESLLDVVEDANGDLDKANAAEERVILELQQMGREAIEHWATAKEKNKTGQYLESNMDKGKIKNKGKKKFIGTQHSEK